MGRKSAPHDDVQMLRQQMEVTCPEPTQRSAIQILHVAQMSVSPHACESVEQVVVAATETSATPLGSMEKFQRVLLQLTPTEQQYVKHAATDPQWCDRLLELPVQNAVAMVRDEIVHREYEQQRIEQFLRRELKWCHMMAGRMVGWGDNEDVVQDASIDLLRYIRRMPRSESAKALASDESLRALMSTITSRRAFDLLRKRQRRKEHVTADGASVERGDDSSMQRSQAALDVDRLERVYREMRPIQRIVHVLHHFYGFTARDCAKALSLKESNVDTLIGRATEMLMQAMEMKS